MYFRKYCIALCCSLLILSCQTQRDGSYFQNIASEDIQAGVIGDENFEMEISYIGAIGHSYVYECYIKNTSHLPMIIDKSQFYLEHGDGDVVFPSEGSALAQMLEKEKRKLKKEKKTSKALGILGIGLSALTGVSTGASLGEAILYNTEPIIYIFDEQRWYKRGINSVEDEIDYVRSAQFNQLRLAPGQEAVRDVLFATTKMKSDVTIFYTPLDNQSFSVTFPKKIFR